MNLARLPSQRRAFRAIADVLDPVVHVALTARRERYSRLGPRLEDSNSSDPQWNEQPQPSDPRRIDDEQDCRTSGGDCEEQAPGHRSAAASAGANIHDADLFSHVSHRTRTQPPARSTAMERSVAFATATAREAAACDE